MALKGEAKGYREVMAGGIEVKGRGQRLMNLVDINRIPEPDTVGDLCRREGNLQTGQMGLKGLGRVRDKLNHRMMKRDNVEAYTLDADEIKIIGENADAFLHLQRQ